MWELLHQFKSAVKLFRRQVTDTDALTNVGNEGDAHFAVSVLNGVLTGLPGQLRLEVNRVGRKGETLHALKDPLDGCAVNVSTKVAENTAKESVHVDSLAVHNVGARDHLQQLGEGVPVVHATLQLELPEVGAQLLQHDLDGQVNDAITHSVRNGRRSGEARLDQCSTVRLQEFEKIGGSNQGKLDDLTHAVGHISVVLRGDEGVVQQARARWVKGSDTVLVGLIRQAATVINTVFHTNAGVHNGQQRCGDTHKRDSPTVGAGSQTGNVQYYTTADSEERFTAAQLVRTHLVQHFVDSLLNDTSLWSANPLPRQKIGLERNSERFTYIGTLVWLSTIDCDGMELNIAFCEVVADLVPVDTVNFRINDGKTSVVSLWVNTGGLEKLRVGGVKQSAVGDHVDIVGNGKCVNVSPSSRCHGGCLGRDH